MRPGAISALTSDAGDVGLLERERELAETGELLERARAGAGSVLAIEGPAGIGKTRLLAHARERAAASGMTVLSARGDELESDFGFGIVRQLFEPALAHAGALTGAAAHAARVLGREAPAGPPPADPDALGAVLHGLYWLAVDLSAQAPLLLAVDDAHWADAASLRWLVYLARRLDELPVALALARRRGEPGAHESLLEALSIDPGATRVEPPPLSLEGARAWVAEALAEEPDGDFVGACHAATGGNPFLLRELMGELHGDGVRPTAANARLVRELEPRSVARATLMRLGRLPAECSDLARAVAVLGAGVSPRHAARVAELDRDAGARAIDALVAAEVLDASPRLSFVHPIVRSAVHGELRPQERSALHARAAEVLAGEGAEAAQLALHLLEASPAGRAEVVETLREAAREALGRGAPDAAVAYLRRALEEPPDAPVHARVLHELGSAEALGFDPAALAHLRAALDAAGDPVERARIVIELWTLSMMVGAATELLEPMLEAIAAVEPLDRELALQMRAQVAMARWVDRSLAAVLEPSQGPEGLTGETAAEQLLMATLNYDRAMAGAPAEELAAVAERALAGDRLLRAPATPQPFWLAVNSLIVADRLDEAAAHFADAIEVARERGSPGAFMLASMLRTEALYRLGLLAEAEADARAALELALELGWALGVPEAVGFLVEALVARGELDEAGALLAEHGLDGEMPDVFAVSFALHARAQLRLGQGRPADALADALECGRRQGEWGVSNPAVVPWRSTAALATLAAGGDRAEARRLADEELELARAVGAPRAVGIAQRVRALAGSGDGIVAGVREAVATLERSPARLDLAAALVDLGAAIRRSGAAVEARESLLRALEIAHRCGARPLAERAREELLASGARPRRPALTGLDALTPSERRVASLAAQGRTNAEIAQALFVTIKTVETHLGSVYRKLGIAGRQELPPALATGG